MTIGLASIGKVAWASVPAYIAAQMLGAFLGATIVWLAYLPHWPVTESPAAKLAVFCTAPAIRNTPANLVTEIIGTFVLVLGVLAILTPKNLNPAYGWDGGFGPVLVGILVWSIGLSLGGPTGYAINPARDWGPRLMQFQSHLLGVPVVRPKVTETTALGAAYLAGLAVGYWRDQKQISAQWQVDRRFTPAMKSAQRKQLEAGWRKALERAKRWEKTG